MARSDRPITGTMSSATGPYTLKECRTKKEFAYGQPGSK
jgi:hypothetical protein